MNLPVFYQSETENTDGVIHLSEESSRHIVQVLRMKTGEKIQLTNGKGDLITAEIIRDHKKHCEVKIIEKHRTRHPNRNVSIGISLIKNTSRFEWFLEKATELGVREIIPLICERTEKQHFRYDRMQTICISAMLQSQQAWLPVLQQPVQLGSFITMNQSERRLIAHCADGAKVKLAEATIEEIVSSLILIGPEGDFTDQEIAFAITAGFIPVSIGDTRLRTETAGVVASAILMIG